MNHRTRVLVLALISALVGLPWLMAGEEDEVHYCQDADGNIVLQTDPCPEPVVPEPAPPPAPPAATRPPVPKPKAVRTTTLPKARRSTSGWTLIQRTPSASRAPRSARKRQTFPTSLVGAAHPATPNFASPESTWRTFVTAVEGDDYAVVGACFTPAALEQLGPEPASIPLEDLRLMLGKFTRIENGGDLGPLWSIYGVRANQRPKWIFFEQTASGEWKITGI
jgi:hypothetical protein